MNTHRVQYGDSLTPLGVQLKQQNEAGVLAAVDLTGKTVVVVIADSTGSVVISETTTGVETTEPGAGKVRYTFPSGQDALQAGTYYLYFRVYQGTRRDTFPVVPKQLRIVVAQHFEDETSS